MNPLLYSTIQTVAYNNGFEVAPGSADDTVVVFSSVYHANEVAVADTGDTLFFQSARNARGLSCKYPGQVSGDGCLEVVHPQGDITGYLGLLAKLFKSASTLQADAGIPSTPVTESIARVKSRLGQHLYKSRQFALWGNACAVTGLREPGLVRASHAKPWADASDSERLDPYNGFPLAVQFDALFDAGLITFSDEGEIVLSAYLSADAVQALGVTPYHRLSKALSPRHLPYLAYHREHVFKRMRPN